MTTARAATGIPFLDLAAMHAELQADLRARFDAVVDASAFIGGEHVEEFESAWATYCGRRHCVGVANGTDAILLTLRALGIGRGDEVIVPANTFVATAEAVTLSGAVPRFVDVDARTLLVDAGTVSAAVTPQTAAIVAVHLYGALPDMHALADVARRYGLALIEDAAQAHGAEFDGVRAGGHGVAGCFSFYPGKNLGALGDGGAVVTDDPVLSAKIRALGNHGRGSSHFDHRLVGTNSRLDGLQAAFLSTKLDRLDVWNDERRRVHAAYVNAFDEVDLLMVAVDERVRAVHHLEVVRVRNRAAVRARLTDAGVATGIHYPVPCNRHDAFAQGHVEALPVAERAADEVLSLPMYPHLSDAEVAHVVDRLSAVLDDVGGSG